MLAFLPAGMIARFPTYFLTFFNSAVQQQLVKTKEYAEVNDMKINEKKTKVMLFNPCRSIDFIPDIQLCGSQLYLVEKAGLT